MAKWIGKSTIFTGLPLLSNRYVPLAWAILIPDVVNITAYHLFLDPRNWFIYSL